MISFWSVIKSIYTCYSAQICAQSQQNFFDLFIINHNISFRYINSDIYTYVGYFLRIDCNKAEEGLKTTPCSECALNALAIDEPLDMQDCILNVLSRHCFAVMPNNAIFSTSASDAYMTEVCCGVSSGGMRFLSFNNHIPFTVFNYILKFR